MLDSDSEYPKRNIARNAIINSVMTACLFVIGAFGFVGLIAAHLVLLVLQVIGGTMAAIVGIPYYFAIVFSRLLQGRWRDALYTNVRVKFEVVR